MYSVNDTAYAVGSPIRRSTDHSLLPAPRSFSQAFTSFIVSQCQGIRQAPFLALDIFTTIRHKLLYVLFSVYLQLINYLESKIIIPWFVKSFISFLYFFNEQKILFHRIGGGERDRTDDLLLAKQALYQLSYAPSLSPFKWWAEEDLNLRPHAYQACALTN